ncbi:unnamed protein product [Thlaspi arvense]|uniref:Uncharacterized protein n=1 Tax=Thlaspi arvense TaxID=13288 RepID=A0AAU9RQD1_THLAR|nr:unnamed protein product [Thlaspi arvense]
MYTESFVPMGRALQKQRGRLLFCWAEP